MFSGTKKYEKLQIYEVFISFTTLDQCLGAVPRKKFLPHFAFFLFLLYILHAKTSKIYISTLPLECPATKCGSNYATVMAAQNPHAFLSHVMDVMTTHPYPQPLELTSFVG